MSKCPVISEKAIDQECFELTCEQLLDSPEILLVKIDTAALNKEYTELRLVFVALNREQTDTKYG